MGEINNADMDKQQRNNAMVNWRKTEEEHYELARDRYLKKDFQNIDPAPFDYHGI